MKIDLEHLHHWMRAIRSSQDPMRTLDAFWKGQVDSKKWLVEKLRLYVFKEFGDREIDIDIHGGWVGVLASLIFQSEILVSKICSIDIDPTCEDIARTMNQIEVEQGRFRAVTKDMCEHISQSHVIINTSFEHVTEEQYNKWLDNLPKQSIIVLQSNNYNIPEHVRTAENLDMFKVQAKLTQIFYSGELEHSLYTRFMIIGKK